MSLHHYDTDTTIVAPATATGGAVVVVRMSGPQAITIADNLYNGRTKLSEAKGYTLHYGDIVYSNGEILDDVVVALFRAPHSYTGDDTVEVTLHGSEYIVSEFLRLAVEQGAVMATPGEFTRRAFLAGKMDLSRAEAVADIIASDSQWSHNVASTQMRGSYSERLSTMRDHLLKLCSLLELELDFSEEDVEFANRTELHKMLKSIAAEVTALKSSFALGNALKNGVTVAIIGEPNVGKSTLLNALVEDDRAMVSDIAGTTRDTIEATTIIDGIRYRFIDTAGLRATDDQL
jgi:tRNA modification GTPase